MMKTTGIRALKLNEATGFWDKVTMKFTKETQNSVSGNTFFPVAMLWGGGDANISTLVSGGYNDKGMLFYNITEVCEERGAILPPLNKLQTKDAGKFGGGIVIAVTSKLGDGTMNKIYFRSGGGEENLKTANMFISICKCIIGMVKDFREWGVNEHDDDSDSDSDSDSDCDATETATETAMTILLVTMIATIVTVMMTLIMEAVMMRGSGERLMRMMRMRRKINDEKVREVWRRGR